MVDGSCNVSWFQMDGCLELDATMVDGSCNVSWFQRTFQSAPASAVVVVSVVDWGEDSIAFGLCGSRFCDCMEFFVLP
jgi:hypothetical protein